MNKQEIEGIVVKLLPDSMVILLADGTCKNIPREKNHFPNLGEKIHYTPQRKALSSNAWLKYAMIASALFLGFVSYLFYSSVTSQASYMIALDVNPSIEIYVDQQDRVLRVEGINESGETIIQQLSPRNSDVFHYVDRLIALLVEENILHPQEQGVIWATLIPLEKEQISSATPFTFKNTMEQLTEKHGVAADIDVFVESRNIVNEAHELNLSVNKYKLYKSLQENNIAVELDQIREETIKDTLHRVKDGQLKESFKNEHNLSDDSSLENKRKINDRQQLKANHPKEETTENKRIRQYQEQNQDKKPEGTHSSVVQEESNKSSVQEKGSQVKQHPEPPSSQKVNGEKGQAEKERQKMKTDHVNSEDVKDDGRKEEIEEFEDTEENDSDHQADQDEQNSEQLEEESAKQTEEQLTQDTLTSESPEGVETSSKNNTTNTKDNRQSSPTGGDHNSPSRP